MLKTAFKYRLIELLRIKDFWFWMLIFPILLITTFHFVTSNISTQNSMQPISIGMVESKDFPKGYSLSAILEEQSDHLKIIKTTEEEARKLLKSGDIKAYISADFDSEMGRSKNTLFIQNMDNEQTFIKLFLDTVQCYENAFFRVQEAGIPDDSFIEEIPISKRAALSSPWALAVFAMLAMSCLNGIRTGVSEIAMQEPDQSNIAARLFMTPLTKYRRFLNFGAASLLLQTIFSCLVVLYCTYIIDVGLKGEFFRFWILMIFGTMTSYCLGTTFGVLFRVKPEIKGSIATILNLILSGMAGMYSVDIKHAIDIKLPLLNQLNPAAIVTNGFYALYYYDGYEMYNKSLIQIILLGIVMFIITLFAVRRCKYDSI